MGYEKLLKEIDENSLSLYEYDMHKQVKGLCIGSSIILNKSLADNRERSCILAEEIGHYKTTVGDITDGKGCSPKQELKARAYAYDALIGLKGLAEALGAGCATYREAAELLGVTEEFFLGAVEYYRGKYGPRVKYEDKLLEFVPYLSVKADNG